MFVSKILKRPNFDNLTHLYIVHGFSVENGLRNDL